MTADRARTERPPHAPRAAGEGRAKMLHPAFATHSGVPANVVPRTASTNTVPTRTPASRTTVGIGELPGGPVLRRSLLVLSTCPANSLRWVRVASGTSAPSSTVPRPLRRPALRPLRLTQLPRRKLVRGAGNPRVADTPPRPRLSRLCCHLRVRQQPLNSIRPSVALPSRDPTTDLFAGWQTPVALQILSASTT